MAKYLGNTGLSRLWSNYLQNFVPKTDELATSAPDTTYPYTIPTTTSKSIVVNIYTSHSGTSSTLTCTLSEAVDINLLFQLRNVSQNAKRWFTVLAGNTTLTITEPDSSLNTVYGRLDNMDEATLVDATDIQGEGYNITINLYNTSPAQHTLSLEDATVDWHTRTVSGKLTRTTGSSTKPAITAKIKVYESDTSSGTYNSYYTDNTFTINANATQTQITNATIGSAFQGYEGISKWAIPVNAAFTTTQSGHYIDCVARSYTSQDHNITLSISNWAQWNLRPNVTWYKSSNKSVYRGTLPGIILNANNLVQGDVVTITMTVYFGSYGNIPYSRFYKAFTYSGSSTLSGSLNDIVDNYYDIHDGTVSTSYIYIDAAYYNSSLGIGSTRIGYFPSANGNSMTGSFVQSSEYLDEFTRPRITSYGTTSLFGTVTLERRFM